MSASLPPSFSSFPDFYHGSNTQPSEPSKDKAKKRDKGVKNTKDSSREGGKKHKRSRVKDAAQLEAHTPDDERLKAKEDLDNLTNEQSSRLFYSDRKGDRYNIEYGGLHQRDIPRYHIVGRKLVY